MYPRISDLINDLFGTQLRLPVQSFGFMMALAFLCAYIVLYYELKRKEGLGIFPAKSALVKRGNPVKPTDILISFLLYGLVGYKLGLMAEDYDLFYDNPQQAILSTKGSWLWALIAGVVAGGWRLAEYLMHRNKPVTEVSEDQGITSELGTVLLIAFGAGLLGAKLFHNFENWSDFIKDPVASLLSFDGLSYYGGLICAGVLIGWYVYKKGYSVMGFADAIAPTLLLSYGIGRIGCQIAGDGDWGIDNTAPKPAWLSWAPDWVWSFDYPHNVINSGIPIEGCTGDFCNHLAVPVYPTPFYEVLMALALFGVLWAVRKRLPYLGQMSGLYLMFNGAERFLIEKIRINPPQIAGFSLTQAEIISSLLFIFGAVLFVISVRRGRKK
ncbi:MAG: diacylglyceryl transferase [Bacteroidetes bacterium]|nr:MAG: diacylglyceryl transferase [Bacteroidota bacterium]